MNASGARPFDAPALPPLSGRRDRSGEQRERARREREQGYADGHAAGLAAARDEVERTVAAHDEAARRLASAAAALTAAAEDLARRDEVALEEIDGTVLSIATELAIELVGRELEITETPVRDALRRAARLAPDRGPAVVRVHPDDVGTVEELAAGGELSWGDAVRIAGDPTIEPGGCVVDVGSCRVDAQLGPAIERLRAADR